MSSRSSASLTPSQRQPSDPIALYASIPHRARNERANKPAYGEAVKARTESCTYSGIACSLCDSGSSGCWQGLGAASDERPVRPCSGASRPQTRSRNSLRTPENRSVKPNPFSLLRFTTEPLAGLERDPYGGRSSCTASPSLLRATRAEAPALFTPGRRSLAADSSLTRGCERA
jgi:hypothetical protein